jgi:CNT family concentrative nucleoside transporter
VNPRILFWGFGLQIAIALFALRTAIGVRLFMAANDLANDFLSFADAGIRFVFGDWPAMTMVQTPALAGGGVRTVAVGFVLAVKVLPVIIFMASLMAVLYHLGIMQRVVALLARGLSRTMHVSGAEALSTVGDIFLGMTEAPLLIRPYVARMTESELFAVMCAGMATIAGSVFLAYVAMGVSAGYLVTASFMSAPAAVMFAKIMVPETGTPETSWSAGEVRVAVPRLDVNVIDAAARGAGEGLQLALNVGGMLIAFVALVSMLDHGVAWVGGLLGHPELNLGRILGAPLTPLAYLMGVPWKEAPLVGSLLGTKTVLNEFIAYSAMTSRAAELSPLSIRITSFALCGFANFGSLAIVLGGLGGMVPERRKDLARLGLKSILAGSLATFLTGTLAGLIGGG